jgi:TDG/mug DNA glycosylase family protein
VGGGWQQGAAGVDGSALIGACYCSRVPRLHDVVCQHPRLLLVGINPGLRSAALGHHFAGLGNPFWRLLHAAGLTPEQLDPADDTRLAEFGVALTNLCPRPTRTAAELSSEEMVRGRRALVRKCQQLEPRVVGLVGITLHTQIFGPRAAGGPGAKADRLGGAPVFVVPNPSGLNASFPGFAHKLIWYVRLRVFVDEVTARGSTPAVEASSGRPSLGRSGA